MNIASANIASYELVSGTWGVGSADETWYKTTIIGRGYDAPTNENYQVTNYSVSWVHGFGTFNIPNDATIVSVKCIVSTDKYWNNSSSGQFTGTLYNDNTAISDSVAYCAYPSDQTHVFELKTITATTLPSVSDINAGKIQLRNSVPRATCGKIFGATLYIEYLGHNGIFNAAIPVIASSGGEIETGTIQPASSSSQTMTITFRNSHTKAPAFVMAYHPTNSSTSYTNMAMIINYSKCCGTRTINGTNYAVVRFAQRGVAQQAYFSQYKTNDSTSMLNSTQAELASYGSYYFYASTMPYNWIAIWTPED